MKRLSLAGLTGLALVLTSCGGGGAGGGDPIFPGGGGGGTGTATCSLRDRQDWVLGQMKDWWLFRDVITNANPSSYTKVDDYIDALTATARAQSKDRYFTYMTSIKEEDAYSQSGSTAGFGLRFSFNGTNRLYVTEAYENGPGMAQGVDRGAEIVAIGTSAGNMETVASLIARDSTAQALVDALGPDTAGTTRVLRIVQNGQTRDVSVTKADFNLQPVSPRYGFSIITDANGEKIGYVNLRTFMVQTAVDPLKQAFSSLRAQGVTKVVVDFRYNGGGSLALSQTVASLIGGNRSTSDLYLKTTYLPHKAEYNKSYYFAPMAESMQPMKIAFIGTRGSASASESVMNAFVPFMGSNVALIGSNTYGKPVGQIAVDRAMCDDRLRVIAFSLQNQAGVGDYYYGMASKMPVTCAGNDDLNYAMGDPREALTKTAVDWLQGRSCTPIGATATKSAQSVSTALQGKEMSPAQRDMPGFF